MNMTDVATWGQLISSAAVLVALVYLSIQTRQTTTLLRSESRQSMVELDQQLLTAVEANPDIFLDLVSEDELSPARKIRISVTLARGLRAREFLWFQYKNGVLDEPAWQSYRNAIPVLLGTKRTRDMWKAIRTEFDPTFTEMADQLIQGQPYSDYWERVLAVE